MVELLSVHLFGIIVGKNFYPSELISVCRCSYQWRLKLGESGLDYSNFLLLLRLNCLSC